MIFYICKVKNYTKTLFLKVKKYVCFLLLKVKTHKSTTLFDMTREFFLNIF